MPSTKLLSLGTGVPIAAAIAAAALTLAAAPAQALVLGEGTIDWGGRTENWFSDAADGSFTVNFVSVASYDDDGVYDPLGPEANFPSTPQTLALNKLGGGSGSGTYQNNQQFVWDFGSQTIGGKTGNFAWVIPEKTNFQVDIIIQAGPDAGRGNLHIADLSKPFIRFAGNEYKDLDISVFDFNVTQGGLKGRYIAGYESKAAVSNTQTAVPEPTTLLSSGVALGFGTFLKRKLKKRTEKDLT